MLLFLFFFTAVLTACSGPPPNKNDSGQESDSETQDDETDPSDSDSASSSDTEFEFTFFVLADPHCNPTADPDQLSMARAVNNVAGNYEWPITISGVETGFEAKAIEEPLGVIFAGDITGSGDVSAWSNELETFKEIYQSEYGEQSIEYPGYIGLGNHDLDRDDLLASVYRQVMWEYVEERHLGEGAPVLVANFDPESRNYSWDWMGVHFVQTHKCATDTTNDQVSAVEWLAEDLDALEEDTPIVIVQHYGFDTFGTEDRWWTADDRQLLEDTLDGYRIIAIFAGHSHFAMTYSWQGFDVYQANNTNAEVNEGNNDGNGSFFIVRITDNSFELVTCRWTSESGDVEFIPPYVKKDI